MTILLADLVLADVAADVVTEAHERVSRAAALLRPLVRVEIQGPHHDLPQGLPVKDAERRSFAYATDLGLLVRDVVHYAQTGSGYSPEDAMAALLKLNHATAVDLDREPPPTFEVFTAAMQVVRHAVVGRVLLATGGAVPPASLAALAGLEPEQVSALVASGELHADAGGIPTEDAERWLRARRSPGIR